MSKLNGIYNLFKKVHCNDIITCVFINRWIFQVTQIVTYMLKLICIFNWFIESSNARGVAWVWGLFGVITGEE